MYLLRDGRQITAQQIKDAFKRGTARLAHGYRYRDGGISTSLDNLCGRDFDTRGDSVWEDLWTRTPETLAEALTAAWCDI